MNIKETQMLIFDSLENSGYIDHYTRKSLKYNKVNYQIMPDELYFYNHMVILIEYENNLRPVESISKYWWLFKQTKWLENNLKINLLITINNQKVQDKYVIRTQAIELLGSELTKSYSNHFNFFFLNYRDLSKLRIVEILNKMINS